MREALRDLGMERARIGVAGLRGGSLTHCSSIDGVVNHTALAQVMSELPNATFDDATDVVGLVRYVKSEEEIAFVRRSAAVAVAGLDELVNLARPGVDAGVLYADVTARLLELRSEYYPLALTLDPIDTLKPRRYTTRPSASDWQAMRYHQRSERDLGRAVDPGLPAGSARQSSR